MPPEGQFLVIKPGAPTDLSTGEPGDGRSHSLPFGIELVPGAWERRIWAGRELRVARVGGTAVESLLPTGSPIKRESEENQTRAKC